MTAVSAEERQAAYERIGHDLERQGREWFFGSACLDEQFLHPVSGLVPFTASISADRAGNGRSHRGQFNTFVLKKNHIIGMIEISITALRMASMHFGFGDAVGIFEEFLQQFVIVFSKLPPGAGAIRSLLPPYLRNGQLLYRSYPGGIVPDDPLSW